MTTAEIKTIVLNGITELSKHPNYITLNGRIYLSQILSKLTSPKLSPETIEETVDELVREGKILANYIGLTTRYVSVSVHQ